MRPRKTEPPADAAPPRWIGASAPRYGTPTKTHTIRTTDEIWLRWVVAARAEGKSVSKWLHGLAAERLKITNPTTTNEDTTP